MVYHTLLSFVSIPSFIPEKKNNWHIIKHKTLERLPQFHWSTILSSKPLRQRRNQLNTSQPLSLPSLFLFFLSFVCSSVCVTHRFMFFLSLFIFSTGSKSFKETNFKIQCFYCKNFCYIHSTLIALHKKIFEWFVLLDRK